MSDLDLSFVDHKVAEIGRGAAGTLPLLQAIQAHYGYLPEPALRRLCEISDITPAAVAGVSSFFDQFRHSPVGEHMVSVCHGTACHVKGAGVVHDALRRHLAIPPDADTDADGRFTVRKVACLGCCTLAPAVQIDEVTFGHLTAEKVPRMLADFLELRATRSRRRARSDEPPPPEPDAGEIRIGLGSCCVARGSGRVHDAVRRAAARAGVRAAVKRVGCVGMCHQTPLLEILPPGDGRHLYAQVQAEDVESIILRHFRPRGVLRRIGTAASRWLDRVLTDETWTPADHYAIEVRDPPVAAFLGRQKHLATECCGSIDPLDLDEYLAADGFVALRQCLAERSPETVIEQIRASGLAGRGGAGYPTGVKWSHVRAAPGDTKYVVCNADEGDPGAFMDRMLLESFPYRIIEGIAIAAHAVGAREGVFYIRAEYPLAVQRIREAIRRCHERGLLGSDKGDRSNLPERPSGCFPQSGPIPCVTAGFRLHLRIMEGAGAFVCGEETALLASLEGRRGMPRLRPPYPAQQGLDGKPTLVNNVETYALVPWIIRHGAEAFHGLGTETSKGTKVFALAGKVARGGLIEVPMGVTLRQIVEEIGGGIAGGKRFKAVQVGGPSGGCVPAALADTPVDYQALTAVGAIMGSGGLVVLDESDCMVDIARYFLEFTQNQSCGKCTCCRVGTRRMLDILERLCCGEGRDDDLEQLETLAHAVKRGSLCGLGKTAPNPVLSTLQYFRDEYEAHLAGRCPAGVCKALVRYRITDDCVGCTICAQRCPADAIAPRPYQVHEIDPDQCIRCGTCRDVCPADAVVVE